MPSKYRNGLKQPVFDNARDVFVLIRTGKKITHRKIIRVMNFKSEVERKEDARKDVLES